MRTQTHQTTPWGELRQKTCCKVTKTLPWSDHLIKAACPTWFLKASARVIRGRQWSLHLCCLAGICKFIPHTWRHWDMPEDAAQNGESKVSCAADPHYMPTLLVPVTCDWSCCQWLSVERLRVSNIFCWSRIAIILNAWDSLRESLVTQQIC